MNADSTEILLEANIFSGARLERKIKLMESERKVLEAKRALQNGFLTAEKTMKNCAVFTKQKPTS